METIRCAYGHRHGPEATARLEVAVAVGGERALHENGCNRLPNIGPACCMQPTQGGAMGVTIMVGGNGGGGNGSQCCFQQL